MLNVWVIQTGATQWRAADRLGGTGQLPLTDDGAGALAAHLQTLRDVQLDAVLADDSEAARQSADLVSERLGGKVRLVEGFRDVEMGLWEGLTVKQVRQRYPKVYRQWRELPASVRPPDGEDFASAFERVVAAVRGALRKRGRRRVAVVASPIVAGLLRCWLLDRAVDTIWQQVADAAPSARYEVTGAHIDPVAAQ